MNELILSFHNETSNIYKWFKSRLVKLLEVHCRSGLYETWINNYLTIKILKFWSGSSLDISRDWEDLFRSFFYHRMARSDKNFWKIRILYAAYISKFASIRIFAHFAQMNIPFILIKHDNRQRILKLNSYEDR